VSRKKKRKFCYSREIVWKTGIQKFFSYQEEQVKQGLQEFIGKKENFFK